MSNRITAEERTGRGELKAGSAGTTFAENPAAEIASDESGAATLHFADGGTGSGETAW